MRRDFVYKTIVIGTDGSPTAGRALARAVETAKLNGARLVIVTAYKELTGRELQETRAALPDEYAWQVTSTGDTDQVLKGAAGVAEKEGLAVTTRAVAGDPTQAILDVADDEEADLIVVGSKGMERRIMGSVPNSIAHRAMRDILIVQTT